MTQYRARTGCLTCRDRHIKCDEASPRCQNCSKSKRLCERGIRLNFIDIQTSTQHTPANFPRVKHFVFHDESQNVASEYNVGPTGSKSAAMQTHVLPQSAVSRKTILAAPPRRIDSCTQPVPSSPGSENLFSRIIDSLDESLLMHIFIEKVGPWLDCLSGSNKPFTTYLPFYALDHPMLYSATLACGASYLTLAEASIYREEACRYLQSEPRNSNQIISVATAVLLSSGEAMSCTTVSPHTERTSALMRQADVKGSSSGLAGACFWSYTLIQLVHSINHVVPPSWNPDCLAHTTWFEDTNHTLETEELDFGKEDYWARRMIYICTKVAVLRAELTYNTCEDSIGQLVGDYEQYNSWCDEWANNVPRSMMPLCYIPAGDEQLATTSIPHVLLVGSSAIVSRLLYHTCRLLLASMTHVEPPSSAYARPMQVRHALDICGIATEVEDKELTHVAACCLLIATEALEDPAHKQEALQILDRITRGTPWAADRPDENES
ncbi:hypothetical protein DM02DRAFT_604910 [Periconia macrospinosa]|uniref:Zn(2)-C6 fungal-type domain-containing protein n=1 Tax=Periconia macrospinosa TaxID=97972 RepID=A0A2V1D3W5_9PLEO|nr:hypothetical protein DM02DRAFT_604910 [Periconia macrospinosa]